MDKLSNFIPPTPEEVKAAEALLSSFAPEERAALEEAVSTVLLGRAIANRQRETAQE